jgi:hypothetical protein
MTPGLVLRMAHRESTVNVSVLCCLIQNVMINRSTAIGVPNRRTGRNIFS